MGMPSRTAANTMNGRAPQNTKVRANGLARGAWGVGRGVFSTVEPKNWATSIFLVALGRLDLFLVTAFTEDLGLVCLKSAKHS